jgi:hypothetical protein
MTLPIGTDHCHPGTHAELDGLRKRIVILEDQVRRLANALRAFAECEGAPHSRKLVGDYLFGNNA